MPGGDPLAAALAAGETPSPEMVAEAGAVGGLTPVAGWACLAALALGVVPVVLAAGRSQLTRLVPLEKPPEVLADQAREIIRALGYRDPPADTAFGFEADGDYLDEVARGANSPQKWSRLRTGPPFAVNFWYRQSPQPLFYIPVAHGPSFADPPSLISGMVGVRLDPEGRLRLLEVAPPERESAETQTVPSGTASSAPAPDWSILLRQAGLDPGALRVVEPVWFPAMFADRRAAWEGAYPATPGAGATPVRIEAASLRGRPVAFRIVEPWTRPLRMEAVAPGGWQTAEQYVLIAVAVAIMVGGALLARRNMLLGRGDRRGALRLAAVILTSVVITWIVRAHHPGGGDEVWRFLFRVGDGLVFASLVWIFYLALEPYLRRLWPRLIVSWVRLLDGRLRDPLVGRDVLLGLLAGTLYSLLNRLTIIGPGWLGLPSIRPDQVPGPPVELFILTGLRSSVGIVFSVLAGALVVAMGILVLLLLARIALRRTWLAIMVVTVAMSLSGFIATGNPYVDVCLGSLIAIVPVSILFRVGVLAMVMAEFACQVLNFYPMTFDTSSWLFGDTFLALGIVAALAVYGFHVALAGRPALGGLPAPGGE
jgi:serine/threonine-protein kinase